ncbi:MAG: bifunctional heptose 7-phosphate kinase/heptose 1-phosphate adenyltransferase [Planctomycetota bacterium]|jgi:rfaE bifunctional protein kinase chain/domain
MSLASLVDGFEGRRIVVLGDLAVDCYVDTLPRRLSSEAPVMILRYEGRRFVPGCAANTIMNLRHLGADVVPIGILGDDEPGEALRGLFRDEGVPTDGIVVSGKSVVKVRIMSGDVARPKQQVMRIDFEPNEAWGEDAMLELVARAGAGEGAEGVIVSDYDYGVASPGLLRAVLGVAPEAKVSVDSHAHIGDYHEVDLLTPNESEASLWSRSKIRGADQALRAARSLREHTQAGAVLLTRGKEGMVLVEEGQDHAIPIDEKDDIVDPSGAGDTVVSTATLARVAGATYLEAAQLANVAAGVTVMKRGAATIKPAELKEAVGG